MSVVRLHSEAPFAGIAHLVERSLAKAEVAGSSPVSRSIPKRTQRVIFGMDGNRGIEAAYRKRSGGSFLAAGISDQANLRCMECKQVAPMIEIEPRFPLHMAP